MDGHLDLDQLARERVGSVLDEKWTIEKLLGVGGMAAVYAARHRNGARAAIKILHPEFARNADVRERFRREGYAANLVEHPGVVKVLDDASALPAEYPGWMVDFQNLRDPRGVADRPK